MEAERKPPFPSAPLRRLAAELGFDALGFARADEPLGEDHARYEAFVARGMHGEMGYLAQHAPVRRRLDGEGILAGAKTVVCFARRYDRPDEDADPPLSRLVARYARGRDYHNHLKKRLNRIAAFLRTLAPGAEARALCDTAPVLERAWAARAGMGFVGKNGLLIVPGQGSFCLLGEVVTSLLFETSAYGQPMADRCGSCRACLDACPTKAFAAPYVLDPRRCLSYQTIERRSVGDAGVAIEEHLFGCDDCQTVCPYNRVPSPEAPDSPFAPSSIWDEISLSALVGASEPSFRRLTEGSPLRRANRRGLARNALHVAAARLGRGGDEDAVRALQLGEQHDDPEVAKLARALRRHATRRGVLA